MKCCCYCDREINTSVDEGNDFVRLVCGCISCPKCIIQNTINRGTDSVKCKMDDHNEKINDEDKINYFFASREYKKKSIKIPVKQFKFEEAPSTFFAREFMKNKNEMKDRMVLNLSYISKDKNQIDNSKLCSATSILDLNHGFESEEDKTNLRIIFGLLHDPIMAHHKVESLVQGSFPRMTPSEFCEYCLEKDDSLLLKLIYAFATGSISFIPPSKDQKNLPKSEKRAAETVSNFLAVCVAKGMIERINSYRPGPFQSMIADVLSLVNAPNPIKDFFSKIRISSGRRTIDRKNILNEIISLRERIVLKPGEAFVMSFDNFSFKGNKGQHAKHIIIQIMVITEKQLRNLGFYDNNKISRKKKSFDELKQEYDNNNYELAKSILVPNDEDFDVLSTRILKTIETVASLNLPSVQECRNILSSNGSVKWQYLLPSNLGVKIQTSKRKENDTKRYQQHSCLLDLIQENTTNSNERQMNENNNEETGKSAKEWHDLPSTFYEANNVYLDHVFHGDPGSDLVIEKLVDYMDRASLVDAADLDGYNLGGEEPVRNIIAPATADGSPSKRWLDFQALDIEKAGGEFEARKYKKPRVFFAGFHFMMEFLTMRGRLCRDLTAFFARKWRPNDKGMLWIYIIRDPGDALDEWRDYLVAHYADAAECAKSKDSWKIHTYMVERAIEIPMCQGILFDLRLLEILFMIRDAEKAGTHGDVDLFLTCLRFSLPLFAVTHATNYCHLVCDFLEWYKLSSEAEQLLFKNFFYTKLSVAGKPIWADRGVEWTVGHIRSFMGQSVRGKSHRRTVERTVADLPLRIRTKRDLRYILNYEKNQTYSTIDWNEQTFQIGDAYLHTRVALHNTNFWGDGPLTGELKCKVTDNIILADTDGNEHAMSSSILGGYNDVGVPRIIEYYIKHHCENRYKKTRSEKGTQGVSLKVLPTTHQRRLRDIEITNIIRCSCDYTEILKLQKEFPKKCIIEELDYYRDFIPDIPTFSESNTRKALVTAVCKYRRSYFNMFPEVEASTIESVKVLDESERATTRESRVTQIKSSRLYYLDKEILRHLA